MKNKLLKTASISGFTALICMITVLIGWTVIISIPYIYKTTDVIHKGLFILQDMVLIGIIPIVVSNIKYQTIDKAFGRKI